MPIQFFGKTDIGSVRDTNQDNFFADYLDCGIDEQVFLAVVCDGMGGASGGSFASSLAIKTFVSELCTGLKNVSAEKLSIDSCELLLSYAAKCANSAVYNAAQGNSELHGMGTTLVGMMVFRNTVYALNIGDSRLYVLGEDGMCKLTRDHSYVQALVDQGKISEAEAKVHFKCTRSRSYISGDYRVTVTDHYDVFRAGSMTFRQVPVDASTKMPDRHMDAIEPFCFEDMKPFSPEEFSEALFDK